MGIIILDEYYDQKPNFNLKQNDFLFRQLIRFVLFDNRKMSKMLFYV